MRVDDDIDNSGRNHHRKAVMQIEKSVASVFVSWLANLMLSTIW